MHGNLTLLPSLSCCGVKRLDVISTLIYLVTKSGVLELEVPLNGGRHH